MPAAWIASGILLFQAAWMFAVPAFGGIDEVDHAYRAASVAEGYWAPESQEPMSGRGALIRVPADIVEAAYDRCARLPYMGRDNCQATGVPDQDGNVLVASASSRYNPAFYWVVGTAARPFAGDSALYAMRAATAVLCAAFIAAALWVATHFARSLWPTVGVLSALTPVSLYATSVAAPNGVQLSAALLLWCSGIALLGPSSRGRERPLLWFVGAAVPVVAATHTTGPMWVGLTIAVLVLLNPRRWAELWRQRRNDVVRLLVWLALTTGAAMWWLVTKKPNLQSDGHYEGLTAVDILQSMFLWVVQSVGAVPFRNDWVPVPAIAICLVSFSLFIAGAAAYANSRQRLAIGIIVAVSFAVPAVLTIASFAQVGLAWQGRYTLPFAIGLAILAASVLDRREPSVGRLKVLIAVTIVGFPLSQAISLVAVLNRQSAEWPEAHSEQPPAPLVLVVTAVIAFALVVTGIAEWSKRNADAVLPTSPEVKS